MNELQGRQLGKMVSRIQDVARLRHMALSTERSYVTWVKRYAGWLLETGKRGDARTKVEGFLTWMAKRDFSSSSQNQAFSALLFFYQDCRNEKLENVNALRAKRRVRVAYAPTVEETRRLLVAIRDTGAGPVRLAVHLLYGCGMRVSEPLNLRLKDVNLKESKITIRQAKGGKDRVVALPCSLAFSMKEQMDRARQVSARDIAEKIPVQLPDRLAKKYPRLRFSRDWAFVFPMNATCRHPRTGETVRYRMLETTVQRAVKAAVRHLGLNEMITPHSLRHAYASHLVDRGTNIRSVQVLMGHKSLDTTMGYVHAEANTVQSPVDSMSLTAV